MKQSEAMKYVRKLLNGVQRSRSAIRESLITNGEFDTKVIEQVMIDLNPWLFGPKGESFIKALAQIDDRDSVTPMEFYNFMTIIHRLDLTINATAGIMTETMYPEPNIQWMSGWEKESEI